MCPNVNININIMMLDKYKMCKNVNMNIILYRSVKNVNVLAGVSTDLIIGQSWGDGNGGIEEIYCRGIKMGFKILTGARNWK